MSQSWIAKQPQKPFFNIFAHGAGVFFRYGALDAVLDGC
jgi:hypothetical protein